MNHVIQKKLGDLKATYKTVQINCGHLKSPSDIFVHIAEELSIPIDGKPNSRNATNAIHSWLSNPDILMSVILVLDEADYLSVRDESVLYTIMEWPRVPNSTLVLLSIANTIDFPDRMLPWLRASGSVPQTIIFEPYSDVVISEIIGDRLQEAALSIPEAGSALDANAIRLCSKKIAASTGDVRSALTVCADAVAARAPCNLPSVKHDISHQQNSSNDELKVLPPAINVVSKIFQKHGESNGAVQTIQSLQLHAQLALCVSASQLFQKNRKKEIGLNQLYVEYRKLCDRQKMQRLSEQEFMIIYENLADTGLVVLDVDKKSRRQKIRMNVTKDDIKTALCGKRYFDDIWNDKALK